LAAKTEDGGESTGTTPTPAWLAIVSRPIGSVLDVFDDVGGTVLLVGRMLTWLVRPPFRWAQLIL
jgi:hypothetical protein